MHGESILRLPERLRRRLRSASAASSRSGGPRAPDGSGSGPRPRAALRRVDRERRAARTALRASDGRELRASTSGSEATCSIERAEPRVELGDRVDRRRDLGAGRGGRERAVGERRLDPLQAGVDHVIARRPGVEVAAGQRGAGRACRSAARARREPRAEAAPRSQPRSARGDRPRPGSLGDACWQLGDGSHRGARGPRCAPPAPKRPRREHASRGSSRSARAASRLGVGRRPTEQVAEGRRGTRRGVPSARSGRRRDACDSSAASTSWSRAASVRVRHRPCLELRDRAADVVECSAVGDRLEPSGELFDAAAERLVGLRAGEELRHGRAQLVGRRSASPAASRRARELLEPARQLGGDGRVARRAGGELGEGAVDPDELLRASSAVPV